jgi:hypothetical protein
MAEDEEKGRMGLEAEGTRLLFAKGTRKGILKNLSVSVTLSDTR